MFILRPLVAANPGRCASVASHPTLVKILKFRLATPSVWKVQVIPISPRRTAMFFHEPRRLPSMSRGINQISRSRPYTRRAELLNMHWTLDATDARCCSGRPSGPDCLVFRHSSPQNNKRLTMKSNADAVPTSPGNAHRIVRSHHIGLDASSTQFTRPTFLMCSPRMVRGTLRH